MSRPILSLLIALSWLAGSTGCSHNQPNNLHTAQDTMWRKAFSQQLPLLGHRNWILIVDQAYPMQSAPGIKVIDTKQPLKPVLSEVLREISAATHVKPVIYTDLELNYLDETLCPGAGVARNGMNDILKKYSVRTILHEEVFGKLDQASKLFNVVALKTTSQIPYSSVFIELDCGYWNDEAEQALRAKMKADKAE